MDLISCRNLLIYLEAGLQKKIMPAFHFALRPRRAAGAAGLAAPSSANRSWVGSICSYGYRE